MVIENWKLEIHRGLRRQRRLAVQKEEAVKWETMLGFFAAACTTIAFLPQVIKACRTKETRDISLPMYIVLITGISLWVLYGLSIGDYPISIANGVTFILVLIILIAKIRYG